MLAETKSGKVRGYIEKDMIVFKGIPYARAPVGALRFKPPIALEAWDGVLEAKFYGNRAMQQQQDEGYVYSEDCLNLNVWTPGIDGKKRPVIFYIHGGGHIEGSNSDEFSTGQRLIRDKEAVMVAPNYRLGAFGYLYLGDRLGEEYAESGNCGLLDQLCALQWVRDNIAEFGGDPENVTLMGQSAGGKSAANLMVTPRAQGMFHKVIIQSGGIQCMRDRVTAAVLASFVVDALDLGENGTQQLLSISAEELLNGQIKAYEHILPVHLFGPVVDGRVLEEPPESFISTGRLAGIPVLIGYNRDELGQADPHEAFDEAEVPDKLSYSYGYNSGYLLSKYRQLRDTMHPGLAFSTLQTRYMYGNASLSLTQLLAEYGSKIWCYRWDFVGNGLPDHSSEMVYLFGVEKREKAEGYPPEHAYMSRLMNETWMAFILNDDPNNSLLPHWPACRSGAGDHRLLLEDYPYVETIDLHAYDKQFPRQVITLDDPVK
ncbi:carboxylesterase/lipase family protein [Paenibacillus wynnii]|uniref:carboxylesterase/lipase family protein n=1 Tax=Paenibacillus wynnii TaxID=268407 RepID=UPI00068B927F|nr:carboxylesterase family protein [Paenibacillus wynnii]